MHRRVHTVRVRVEYEWDERKAVANLRKHGIDFADAVMAFEDDRAIRLDDDHPAEKRLSWWEWMLWRVSSLSPTRGGESGSELSLRARQHRERRKPTVNRDEKGI